MAPSSCASLILGVALGAVVATDLAEHRIPNRIVVPAAIACAALLAARSGSLRSSCSAASPSSR